MDALVAEGSADPMVVSIDEPRPGRGEVSLTVEVAGVNFADVMALRGDHGYAEGARYTPGLEVVGTVRRRGPGVESPPVGQRVVAYLPGGGFAEVAVVNVNMLVALPDTLDSMAAVAVPVTLSTAHLLLEDVARVRPADVVLVHSAAGGMGQAFAACLRGRPDLHPLGGLRLLGTVSSGEKTAAALAAGYDEVFLRDERLASSVLEATGGLGATVVLGALGTSALDVDLRLTAPTGRIIRFGNASGAPAAPLPSLTELNTANVSIAGFSRRALARRDPARVRAAFTVMIDQLVAEQVVLPVSAYAGLAALPHLLGALARGETTGKLAVRLTGAGASRVLDRPGSSEYSIR